jgi:hypothetical protein
MKRITLLVMILVLFSNCSAYKKDNRNIETICYDEFEFCNYKLAIPVYNAKSINIKPEEVCRYFSQIFKNINYNELFNPHLDSMQTAELYAKVAKMNVLKKMLNKLNPKAINQEFEISNIVPYIFSHDNEGSIIDVRQAMIKADYKDGSTMILSIYEDDMKKGQINFSNITEDKSHLFKTIFSYNQLGIDKITNVMTCFNYNMLNAYYYNEKGILVKKIGFSDDHHLTFEQVLAIIGKQSFCNQLKDKLAVGESDDRQFKVQCVNTLNFGSIWQIAIFIDNSANCNNSANKELCNKTQLFFLSDITGEILINDMLPARSGHIGNLRDYLKYHQNDAHYRFMPDFEYYARFKTKDYTKANTSKEQKIFVYDYFEQ